MSESSETEPVKSGHRRGRPPPPPAACERAWQLHESGRYGSVRAIRQQLAVENPEWAHDSNTTTADWIKRGRDARAAELAWFTEPLQRREQAVTILSNLLGSVLTELEVGALEPDNPTLLAVPFVRGLLSDIAKLTGANAAAKLDTTISRAAPAGVLADTRDRIMASNGLADGGDVMAATRASYARRQLRAVGSAGASDTDAPGGTDDLNA